MGLVFVVVFFISLLFLVSLIGSGDNNVVVEVEAAIATFDRKSTISSTNPRNESLLHRNRFSKLSKSKKSNEAAVPRRKPRRWRWGQARIEKMIDRAFYDADVNHDGTISFQEAYEGVLQIYIKVNRQADIDPPPRYRILQLYLEADVTKTGRLNREEFGSLTKRVTRRAFLRVGVKKIITIMGAPALAEAFVHFMSKYRSTVEQVFRFLVPDRFHDKCMPVPLLTPAFHRSVWTVIFVATLGNICISVVNFVLDLNLPDEDEQETIKQLKKRRDGDKFRKIVPKKR